MKNYHIEIMGMMGDLFKDILKNKKLFDTMEHFVLMNKANVYSPLNDKHEEEDFQIKMEKMMKITLKNLTILQERIETLKYNLFEGKEKVDLGYYMNKNKEIEIKEAEPIDEDNDLSKHLFGDFESEICVVGNVKSSQENRRNTFHRFHAPEIKLLSPRVDTSITTKRPSSSFEQFYLVSIRSETLLESNDISLSSNGLIRFHSSCDLLDYFSSSPNNDKLANNTLSSYAFPKGVGVRFFPRCAMEGAKRLGWLGEEGDKYQFHIHTNEKGEKIHGISITVKTTLTLDSIQGEKLKEIRKQVKATRTICRTWRKYKNGELKRSSSFGDKIRSIFSWPSFEAKTHASISHSAMKSNEELGDVCIVEKCYILVGVKPGCESLLFNGLQQLVDLEKDSNGRYKLCMNYVKAGEEGEQHLVTDEEARLAFLGDIRKKLVLTLAQSQIKYTNNIVDHMKGEPSKFECSLVKKCPKINIPLPLPQITSEWGFAILAVKFKLPIILRILLLLLLEKSFVIIGDREGQVQITTCALQDLLRPYKWTGIFLSLIPNEALDILASPIPFIAGCVAEDREGVENFIASSSIQKFVKKGLSIMNLLTGEVIFTKGVEDRNLIAKCYSIIRLSNIVEKLDYYQNRIEYLREQRTITALSFRDFFENGISRRESLTLKSTKQLLFQFLSTFAGGIAQPSGWKMYGILDAESDYFEFCPSIFIGHLKYLMDFQELLVHTTLFQSYVNQRKEGAMAIKRMKKSVNAARIAYFIKNKSKLCLNLQ